MSGKIYEVPSGQYFDTAAHLVRVVEGTFKLEMRNTFSSYTLKCVVAYCW